MNGKLRDRGGSGWQVITFRCQKLKKRHNRQTYSTRFVRHNGGITIHRYDGGQGRLISVFFYGGYLDMYTNKPIQCLLKILLDVAT